MFKKLGNGKCWGSSSMDVKNLQNASAVTDVESCADQCSKDDSCFGFEFGWLDNSKKCLLQYDSLPRELCISSSCSNTAVAAQTGCYARTSQVYFSTLSKQCELPNEIPETDSTTLLACLSDCTSLEDCLYARFHGGRCSLWTDCSDWSSTEEEGSVTVERIQLQSTHDWVAKEQCLNSNSSWTLCQGGFDFHATCLKNCDDDKECLAIGFDLDEEVEQSLSLECSDIYIGGIFEKGDLLGLIAEDAINPSVDNTYYTLHTNLLARLLCAVMLVFGAFCSIKKWARANTSLTTMDSQNQGRHVPVPTDVWKYLNKVSTPETIVDEVCSICLEPFESEVSQAPCGHVFHQECIQKWLLYTKKECPNCRYKVYAAPPPGPHPDDYPDIEEEIEITSNQSPNGEIVEED